MPAEIIDLAGRLPLRGPAAPSTIAQEGTSGQARPGYDCEPFSDGRAHRRRCVMCGATDLAGRFDRLGDPAAWASDHACSPCLVDCAIQASEEFVQQTGGAAPPLFLILRALRPVVASRPKRAAPPEAAP